MYVWSKRFAIAALAVFVILEIFLIARTAGEGPSGIRPHTIQYLLVNYILLAVWVFIWMFDQARLRDIKVGLWLVPFLLAPVPTLLIFILIAQRR
jgi:hypothetical protein